MRVLYRSVRSVYRQGRVNFCCAAMCRWWGLLLGFGARVAPPPPAEKSIFTWTGPRRTGPMPWNWSPLSIARSVGKRLKFAEQSSLHYNKEYKVIGSLIV